jgi:ribosomal protein S5
MINKMVKRCCRLAGLKDILLSLRPETCLYSNVIACIEAFDKMDNKRPLENMEPG